VAGGTGASGAYNWSQPSSVSINTPASGAPVTALTTNWTPSVAGIIDHYQVDIYQNGAIVGFNNNVSSSATSIPINATSGSYLIESISGITASVIEYYNSISGVAGLSPSYLWGVPTNVYTPPGEYPGPTVSSNPVLTWTTQQYKQGSNINYVATLYSAANLLYQWYQVGTPVSGTNVNTLTVNYTASNPDNVFYYTLKATDVTSGLSTTVSSNIGVWTYSN
jgi:hypothetical protein